jgi:hypothetical protein
MKTSIASLLLVLSLGLFAQEPPKFLDGFNYTKEVGTSSEGELFDFFEVREDNFKELKRVVNKLGKHKKVWVDSSGLLITHREVDGWVVMTFSGFGFKRISVFQE